MAHILTIKVVQARALSATGTKQKKRTSRKGSLPNSAILLGRRRSATDPPTRSTSMDQMSAPSTHCVYWLTSDPKADPKDRVKTHTVKRTFAPHYDHSHTFEFDANPDNLHLVVEVRSRGRFGREVFMGRVEMFLQDALQEDVSGWFSLRKRSDSDTAVAGEIYLQVTYACADVPRKFSVFSLPEGESAAAAPAAVSRSHSASHLTESAVEARPDMTLEEALAAMPPRPAYKFDLPDSDDNMVREPDSTKIRAASLYKVVEAMTDSAADVQWIRSMLYTYTAFCTPLQLYQLLCARYQGPPAGAAAKHSVTKAPEPLVVARRPDVGKDAILEEEEPESHAAASSDDGADSDVDHEEDDEEASTLTSTEGVVPGASEGEEGDHQADAKAEASATAAPTPAATPSGVSVDTSEHATAEGDASTHADDAEQHGEAEPTAEAAQEAAVEATPDTADEAPEQEVWDVTEEQIRAWEQHGTRIQGSVMLVLQKWISDTQDFAENVVLRLVATSHLSEGGIFANARESVRGEMLHILGEAGEPTTAVEDSEHSSALLASTAVPAFHHVGPRLNAALGRRSSFQSQSQSPVLELNVEDIADQITLIEYEKLRAVLPREFVGQAWNKHMDQCRGTVQLIEWFNRMSNWVATEIIKQDTPEMRAVIVAKFIEIASRLFVLRNYGGVMEVLAALNNSAITRLKATWALIPEGLQEQLGKLEEFMKPIPNFRAYREAITTSPIPWIPYLGVHLTDLTFIDDGNETYTDDGLINVDKLQMIADTAIVLKDAASSEYFIEPLSAIRRMLHDIQVFDDNEVYRMSKLREPPGSFDAKQGGGGRRTSIMPGGLLRSNRTKNLARAATSMMNRQEVKLDADKELTERDWQSICAGATLLNVKAGDVIVREGQRNGSIYRIKSGVVDVVKGYDSEGAQHLATMEAGAVFGEVSLLLASNKASATVLAGADGAQLYKMSLSFIDAYFASQDDIAERFYLNLTQKLSGILLGLNPKSKTTQSEMTAQREQVAGKMLVSSSASDKKGDSASTAKDSNDPLRGMRKAGLPQGQVLVKSWEVKSGKKSGKLLLTDAYLCFEAELFMSTTRKVTPISATSDWQLRRKELTYNIDDKRVAFTFETDTQAADAYKIISSVRQSHVQSVVSNMLSLVRCSDGTYALRAGDTTLLRGTAESPSISAYVGSYEKAASPEGATGADTVTQASTEAELSDDDGEGDDAGAALQALTPEDWDLLLNGAKKVKAKEGTTIIQAGVPFQKIYQVTSGSCDVYIETPNGDVLKVATLREGELFGEISFVKNTAKSAYVPSASVVAGKPADPDEEDAVVQISEIPGYFVSFLFDLHPGFAGRFFRFLAQVLARRVTSTVKVSKAAAGEDDAGKADAAKGDESGQEPKAKGEAEEG